MNMEKFLHNLPKIEYLPSYNPKPETGWRGIKALWYEGARYEGKLTKVFAYIGFPEMNEDEIVPAVVLVHGGGGHAYAEWIKVWNQRGYAAIAMDTTGYVPSDRCKGLTGIENGKNEEYVRELCGELEDDNYTLGPDNSEMRDFDLALEEQWMYHAIVDTILAHNILRADVRIDRNKIGICGVSWGGVITSLAIGYDTRYAFAIPIYGSAYLGKALTKVTSAFQEKKVAELWSAEERLDNVKFPVLWLCGLKDQCFCCESNSDSYLATKKHGSVLSIREDLLHGHIVAWKSEECYRFADSVINRKVSFVYPITEPNSGRRISFEVLIPEDLERIKVRLIYLKEPFYYEENGGAQNVYYTANVEMNKSIISAHIPKEAHSYYFEFEVIANGKRIVSTTALIYSKGEC